MEDQICMKQVKGRNRNVRLFIQLALLSGISEAPTNEFELKRETLPIDLTSCFEFTLVSMSSMKFEISFS